MFFSSEDLPPQLRDAYAAQKLAHDQRQMSMEEIAHSIINSIMAVPSEIVFDLSRVFTLIANGETPAVVAAYYAGVFRLLAHTKHGDCMACGENHDQELAKLAAEPPAAP